MLKVPHAKGRLPFAPTLQTLGASCVCGHNTSINQSSLLLISSAAERGSFATDNLASFSIHAVLQTTWPAFQSYCATDNLPSFSIILCYRQLIQLFGSSWPVLQTTCPAFQFILCYRQLSQLFNSSCATDNLPSFSIHPVLQTTCPAFQFTLCYKLAQLFNSSCATDNLPSFSNHPVHTDNLLNFSIQTAPRTAPSPCVRMLQEAVTLRG